MKIKSHIYFVPGLAAGSNISENIRIADEHIEIHYLNWLVPLSINESIREYAIRMCEKITHETFAISH